MVKNQAAAGTAETTTTGGYGMPIIDGNISPNKEYGDLPRQGSSMLRLGRYAQRATVGGTVTLLAHPEALGLLLYNALGTELAVQTVGGATVHTFIMNDAWPGQMTVWARLSSGADEDTWRFRDACISRLQIQGTSGENLQVEVEFVAKHYTKLSAGLPAGYTLEDEDPRFKYIGTTARLDSDSAVPVIMSNAESITFEVARDPEVRYGSQLTPSVYAPDRMVNFSANVMYDTGAGGSGATAFDKQGWAFIEDAYLAALDGDPDQSTPTGSFDVTFGRHPLDAARYLRVVSGGGPVGVSNLPTVVTPQQNWHYETTRPAASGSPTLIGYDLNGVAARPAAGPSEATVVLANDRATLYSV